MANNFRAQTVGIVPPSMTISVPVMAEDLKRACHQIRVGSSRCSWSLVLVGFHSLGPQRISQGKPHLKTGLARPGFKFNFASMPVADDAIADDQAKPGAGADG